MRTKHVYKLPRAQTRFDLVGSSLPASVPEIRQTPHSDRLFYPMRDLRYRKSLKYSVVKSVNDI